MTVRNEIKETCVVCGGRLTRTHGPGQVPLTCSPECQRIRRNQKATAWRASHEIPPDKHGTLYGYVTLSCACDECRQFWAGYVQSRRLAAKEGKANG